MASCLLAAKSLGCHQQRSLSEYSRRCFGRADVCFTSPMASIWNCTRRRPCCGLCCCCCCCCCGIIVVLGGVGLFGMTSPSRLAQVVFCDMRSGSGCVCFSFSCWFCLCVCVCVDERVCMRGTRVAFRGLGLDGFTSDDFCPWQPP